MITPFLVYMRVLYLFDIPNCTFACILEISYHLSFNILKLCISPFVCPYVRLFGQNKLLNLGKFSLIYKVNTILVDTTPKAVGFDLYIYCS